MYALMRRSGSVCTMQRCHSACDGPADVLAESTVVVWPRVTHKTLRLLRRQILQSTGASGTPGGENFPEQPTLAKPLGVFVLSHILKEKVSYSLVIIQPAEVFLDKIQTEEGIHIYDCRLYFFLCQLPFRKIYPPGSIGCK